MAHYRMNRTRKRLIPFALAMLQAITVAGCSSPQQAVKRANDESLITEKLPSHDNSAMPQYKAPEFVPMTEEIVPVRTKVVNIVVRNSALGDVLHVLAEAGGLNLLIGSGVPLDQPVTLSLRNVTAQDALKALFSSVDCFYSIQGNVLKVESVSTKIFELGHPALVGSYSIDVGGDILGGAMVTASSSTGSGGTSSSNLKGSIQSTSKADAKAYDFWESLEKSLVALLEIEKQTGKSEENRAAPPSRDASGQPGSRAMPQNPLDRAAERNFSGQGDTRSPVQNVTVNRLTGTIMVTAGRKGMERVERYIENLKKVLGRQVMIEARIIEVQLNEGLNFGIDWSFLDNVKGLGGTLNAGFGGLNMASRSFTDATDTAAEGSKFQVGVSRSNFQSLLTALKTQGDVKTLSNPKVNVMNGHVSILTVGRNTSYISKVTSTTSVSSGAAPITTFNVETGSILSGVIMGIVPYISESGEISLNITPITSDLISLTDKSVGAIGNQTSISIPTVDLREMTTTVKMQDGQMVIIGGLISRKTTTDNEKIPLLGDIPLLGKLFTRINNKESRSELVLLLRPNIVNGME